MFKHDILSNAEYRDWTQNWKDAAAKSGPFPYFMGKDELQIQTGVVFHFHTLRYLFSTPAVVTIRVRFGLDKPADDDTARFHLILYGVNSHDEIITSKYTSSSFTHHHHYPQDVLNEGNLPQVLMHLWKENWHEQATAKQVSKDNFMISGEEGGWLKGYSYPLREVMDAVGTFKGASHIHIKFGLHEYYYTLEGADAEPTLLNTFGLILYAGTRAVEGMSTPATGATTQAPSVSVSGGLITEETDSGFYDFTAPCPYTC